MTKELAIIGASYLQLPLIEKAKDMGYRTHVFAWKENAPGETVADVFYPISITEISEIAEVCKEIGICGICSIATDLGNLTVNYVANLLGLPGNSMGCALKSTNKYLMREAFKKYGDPSPYSILVDTNTDLASLHLKYPVIIKPTDRSGSRGINKINKDEDLSKALNIALGESFEKKALVEEYVEGQEYSVEGISYQGEHHILAVTQKYTTGSPHFIETGHMEPAPIDHDLFQHVCNVVKHALNSLEIKNGASHTEIKIDENRKISIIEIGSRMGGDCIGSDLVLYSTGIDYLRAVIQVACGEKPDLEPICTSFPVEVRFLISKEDVEEMKRLKETDRFIKLVAYYPENLGHTTDSSNRAGCYLLRV